jgi:ABC-type sugar transport system permease subunit
MTGETRLAVLLLLPAAALVGGLYLLPTLVTLLISFQARDIGPNFAEVFGNISNLSLQNYLRSFNDPVWQRAMIQTGILTGIVVGLGLPLSLGIALLLSQDFWGRSLLRAMILLPWAIPPIVNGTMWTLVYHPQIGTLNAALTQLGVLQRYTIWLGDPIVAIVSASIAVMWRFIPFMTLFTMAGLQNIPKEIYESAAIDGAGIVRRFLHITLPAIKSVLITVAAMQVIWVTKVFDEIWALIKGGAAGTTVMSLWIYRQAFEFLNFAYGSALAYILALITALVVFAHYYFVVRRSEVER